MAFARETGIGPARYYGLLWRWHFFAALIVMPFVLWQSTTGTLYLWSQRWMDHARPELRFVAPGGRMIAPSAQIAAALNSVPDASASAMPAMDQMHMHMGTAMQPSGSAVAVHAPDNPDGRRVLDILLPDEAGRSTAVLLQETDGLPYPIFVNPYDGHVLGSLGAGEWLPGWTRSLHGGWPLGAPGSWLLELGDCWAIVMILTGFYLWWPHGRRFPGFLRPRFGSGTRLLLHDLHSTVAVLFSAAFLFFLLSALPWTSFWGGELLPRIENAIGQTSPAGFSTGGASVGQVSGALPSLDEAVKRIRASNVRGTLDVRLSPWAGARWWIANVFTTAPDHTLEADIGTGHITSDFTNDKIPMIPRFVAFGVHVHQGDFGLFNLWLNTGFALSLVWLTITGATSWWIRRPRYSFGVPPKSPIGIPAGFVVGAVAMSVALPIFGASVILLAVSGSLRRIATPRRWHPKVSG
jgi:uncharacterized iron-regulated membrane protein